LDLKSRYRRSSFERAVLPSVERKKLASEPPVVSSVDPRRDEEHDRSQKSQ
jgi:hypothetical protein